MTTLETERRVWTLTMPPGIELLNANDRARHNRYRSARLVEEWRHAAAQLARHAHIPRLERVSVRAVYRMPDRRLRDVGNLYPTVKACIDGIRDAKVIPDDNWRHLVRLEMTMAAEVARPGLMTIHLVEED